MLATRALFPTALCGEVRSGVAPPAGVWRPSKGAQARAPVVSTIGRARVRDDPARDARATKGTAA